jgi:hypothetical protein
VTSTAFLPLDLANGIGHRLRNWALSPGGPDFAERFERAIPSMNEYGVDPFGYSLDFSLWVCATDPLGNTLDRPLW